MLPSVMGLSAESLALNREVRAHGQLVFNDLADAANVDGGIVAEAAGPRQAAADMRHAYQAMFDQSERFRAG